MRKSSVTLAGVGLVVCAAGLLLQHRGLERLREENGFLRTRCSAVQSQEKKPAKSDELERLRQAEAELPRLRSLVERLRTQVKHDGAFERAVATGFVPRDWFNHPGYGDAWSAHESAMTYLAEGNIPGYLDSFTPEGREAEAEKLKPMADAEGKTQAEIGAGLSRELAELAGFRVLSTNMVDSNVVVMRVRVYGFDGASRPYRVKVAQTGNEWKLITPPFEWDGLPERAGEH